MNILVLNLTRMGDLIQSTPLLGNLKRRYPDSQLILVISRQFSHTAEVLPFADEIKVLDIVGLIEMAEDKRVDVVEKYKRLREATGLLFGGRKYDLIINLTHNKLSALLIYLANDAGEVSGINMTRDGFRRITNPWMTYFFNFTVNRRLNPFNLVDMYKRCAGGDNTDRRLYLKEVETEPDVSDLLEGAEKGKRIIAIQPGASHKHKQWDVEYLGILSGMLKKELDCTTVLLGAKHEAHLAKHIKTDINLIGRTSVKELAAVLKKCDLLITNDTGTMHIASAAGIKIILLSIGAAFFTETGPYGEGNFVLNPVLPCLPCDFTVNCANMECTKMIKPEHVLETARAVIENKLPEYSELFRNIAIFRSEFDENGFIYFKPIFRHEISKTEFFKIIYLFFWIPVLDKKELKFDIKRLKVHLEGFNLKKEGINLKEETAGLENVFSLLKKAIELAGELEDKIFKNGNKEELLAVSNRLTEIDDRIISIGISSAYIQPLTGRLKSLKENFPEADLKTLAKMTAGMYKTLLCETEFLRNLCITALSMVRDKAGEKRKSSGLADYLKYNKFSKESLDVILFSPDYFLVKELQNAFLSLGHRLHLMNIGESGFSVETLLETIVKVKPDFILTINHFGFDEAGSLAGLLSRFEIPFASWFVDSPDFILDGLNGNISDFCTLFIWEKDYCGRMKKAGYKNVFYLPLATDPSIFTPGGNTLNVPEVTFVGNSMCFAVEKWKNEHKNEKLLIEFGEDTAKAAVDSKESVEELVRKKWSDFFIDKSQSLEHNLLNGLHQFITWRVTQHKRIKLAESLTDFDFGIYGDDDWGKLITGCKIFPPVNYYTELPDIYRSTIFNINSTSRQMKSALNQRVFDVTACRGFLITDAQEEAFSMFKEGEEIVIYSSLEELKEKVKFYKTNPEKKDIIKEKGYLKTISAHTYKKRLSDMISVLSHLYKT